MLQVSSTEPHPPALKRPQLSHSLPSYLRSLDYLLHIHYSACLWLSQGTVSCVGSYSGALLSRSPPFHVDIVNSNRLLKAQGTQGGDPISSRATAHVAAASTEADGSPKLTFVSYFQTLVYKVNLHQALPSVCNLSATPCRKESNQNCEGTPSLWPRPNLPLSSPHKRKGSANGTRRKRMKINKNRHLLALTAP